MLTTNANKKNFTTINHSRQIKNLSAYIDTTRTVKKVFQYLADRASKNESGYWQCFPKQQTIATAIKVSRATVNRAIAMLEAMNLISIDYQYYPDQTGQIRRTSNLYTFNLHALLFLEREFKQGKDKILAKIRSFPKRKQQVSCDNATKERSSINKQTNNQKNKRKGFHSFDTKGQIAYRSAVNANHDEVLAQIAKIEDVTGKAKRGIEALKALFGRKIRG